MVTKAKLPEIRKEAFKKAREALGLSAKDVSGMSCFSVRQIEQIENGESSSYYGAQNKVTAAKKVAEILKLSEEEAFDFGATPPTPKSAPAEDSHVAVKNDSPHDSVAENKSKIPKASDVSKTASNSAPLATPKSYEPIAPLGAGKRTKQGNPKKRLIVLLGIAAAVIFSAVNLRPLFFPEPPKEEVVIVEEVVQAPEPETKPEAAAAAAVPECPATDSSVMNYKVDAPKKPGDMVYAQSKTAQTICVVDATGKTQIKVLEPAIGVSFYGKPPLKVLTNGLNQVELFYQGDKVRLKNAVGKSIILEPAEVIQPIVPVVTTESQP